MTAMLKRVLLSDLHVTRAGSDYVPGVWTISVKYVNPVKGQIYEFVRSDGTSYEVKALRKEALGWLFVEF